MVFEATSAWAHAANAPRYAEAGIRAIDLTPAALGPYCCPAVNLEALNLNMITCGGQASVPIVAAVSRAVEVPYAEIVASIASRSAGPGTQANIDEFTEVTARALQDVGGAARDNAIIILNPVEPPMIIRNTVFCAIGASAAEPGPEREVNRTNIHAMVDTVRRYVPAYSLRADPQLEDPDPRWRGMARVGGFLEVRGRGDYLPDYSGSLNTITAAAAHVAELLAAHIRGRPRRSDRMTVTESVTEETTHVRLTDSTLRDGSHAIAHQFTEEQVRAVVHALDVSNVEVIEVSHGDGLGGSSFNSYGG